MFLIYKGSTAVYDPGKGTHRGIVSMKTETKQAGKQRNRVSSPFSLTLTTRWCLLQRRRWPGSVLMPGKCSLRAGTGVLVYCGHCVVCTQLGLLLTLGGFRAGGIGAFSCAGCFHYTPSTYFCTAPRQHTPGSPPPSNTVQSSCPLWSNRLKGPSGIH